MSTCRVYAEIDRAGDVIKNDTSIENLYKDFCEYLNIYKGIFTENPELFMIERHTPDNCVREKQNIARRDSLSQLPSNTRVDRLITIEKSSRSINVTGSEKFYWPVPTITHITAEFSGINGGHFAIDIGGERNIPICSSNEGEVWFSDYVIGMGWTIIIKHCKIFDTLYTHNAENLVKVGKKVYRGQHIANMGSSGGVPIEHLHFAIWENKIPINPSQFWNNV